MNGVLVDVTESEPDLVIDDDVEGETLLGAGRDGLLRQRSSEERVGRPGPERSSRTRGMSGLVSATKEVSDTANHPAQVLRCL